MDGNNLLNWWQEYKNKKDFHTVTTRVLLWGSVYIIISFVFYTFTWFSAVSYPFILYIPVSWVLVLAIIVGRLALSVVKSLKSRDFKDSSVLLVILLVIITPISYYLYKDYYLGNKEREKMTMEYYDKSPLNNPIEEKDIEELEFQLITIEQSIDYFWGVKDPENIKTLRERVNKIKSRILELESR